MQTAPHHSKTRSGANGLVSDVKFARINATADGDNTVVAAVTGKKIRVLGMVVSGVITGTVAYKSGAATTLFQMIQANTVVIMFTAAPYWVCETAVGEAFVVNNPAGTDTIGSLIYAEVD